MTFGGYEYGVDTNEIDVDDGSSVGNDDGEQDQTLPPDHPMSTEQCDHPNCKQPTPEPRQRICDECVVVMDPDTADRCSYCGVSL